MVKFLLETDEYGLNSLDSESRNALIRACENGRLDVAKLLLERKARRETSSSGTGSYRTIKASALAAASAGGHTSLVRMDITAW